MTVLIFTVKKCVIDHVAHMLPRPAGNARWVKTKKKHRPRLSFLEKKENWVIIMPEILTGNWISRGVVRYP